MYVRQNMVIMPYVIANEPYILQLKMNMNNNESNKRVVEESREKVWREVWCSVGGRPGGLLR